MSGKSGKSGGEDSFRSWRDDDDDNFDSSQEVSVPSKSEASLDPMDLVGLPASHGSNPVEIRTASKFALQPSSVIARNDLSDALVASPLTCLPPPLSTVSDDVQTDGGNDDQKSGFLTTLNDVPRETLRQHTLLSRTLSNDALDVSASSRSSDELSSHNVSSTNRRGSVGQTRRRRSVLLSKFSSSSSWDSQSSGMPDELPADELFTL